MPSAQDCAERLRKQAYRTLLPQIQDLEEELNNISGSLSAGVHQIGRKIEALHHIELPTTEAILGEILEEIAGQRELEKEALLPFVRTLRRRETQEEILSWLLDGARAYAPRLALFAVRGDRFIGWSSRGYAESSARSISSCSFPCSEYLEFRRALEGEDPVTASDLPEGEALQALRDDAQGPWHLMPLRALERPVAVLVAGGAKGIPCQADALAILSGFTSLHLENIALKILYELTAARPEPILEPTRAPAEMVSEPIPEPTRAAVEMVSEPVPPVSAPPADSVKIQLQEARPIPEEEKLHTDAKRFARLLVSEIKLYNEHRVVEGRENRDLYLRLKRDIDRSREMYEKRVSRSVSRKIDYFHDEIIRILGDNDPSTLGSDYPGPRVES